MKSFVVVALCGVVLLTGCGKARRADEDVKGTQENPLSALLGKSLKAARTSEASARVGIRGRQLFVAIVSGNIEREAAGLPSLWPHTEGSPSLSDDKEDIAGTAFANATDYFKVLFDMNAYGKESHSPYVSACDPEILKLSEQSGFCDWIIAANLTEEDDDVIPVLITANVDPSTLKTAYDGKEHAPIPFGSKVGRTTLPWCDDFVVVVRKSGACEVFKAGHFTYAALYHKLAFSAPNLKYLDVK